MTEKFLRSIGMKPLAEYKLDFDDSEDTERMFYQTVLLKTDEAITSTMESFFAVFSESTALTLVGNLLKWAATAIPAITETMEARTEARDALK